VGLTACEASKLSISWADGDPSKMTVLAGLNGGQKINWSADGNIENCNLVTAAVAGTLTISSTAFSANTNGGSFAAALDHEGGYAETTLRLYCNWDGPFNSKNVLWSNTLKVTTTDPVTATVQGPPGAPVLYGTKIQASSDSFATSSSNACVANDTTTSVGTITTVLQLKNTEATGIAAGPDGAMWFPYRQSNNARIGRIDMAGTWSAVGQAPFYSQLTSIAAGLDGAMWIGAEGWTATGSTEFTSTSRISRITMNGGLENFDTLADDDFITDITAGPDGAAGPDGGGMWFTNKSQKGRSIGRITLGGVVTEYPMVNASGGIAAGPDGAMWFTQLGKIGRITTRGSITEYSIPAAFGSPRDIAAGPDGAMWFPAGEEGKGIGRITMAGDVTTMSDRMLHRFAPARIAAGPDGAMWIADRDHITRITMAGEVSSWNAVPFVVFANGNASDYEIRDIAAGPDGAMWFVAYDDDAGSTIRRITTGSVQGSCRLTAVKGQQARVMLKPPSAGQMWLTGPCPASAATFVVRPGDQVDGSGYASPACLNGFSAMSNVTVPVEQVTPLAVMVSGPISSRGLYGIRVGSADAGGFRPAAEVCASTGSTSCTAKVVPGDTVTVGLKPPTEAGMALQGTCPSGATFQITSSSPTDGDGYATACPSFTPSDSTTDISVQKVPVRSLTVTGPADRPGLFGIAILSAPPGGSNVTRTVCTDLTKACTATFPAGGNVIAGFKPPSEGTLVGTCPGTGSAFTVTAASYTDDSGYHFPCPRSITPSVNSTTLSVQYVAPPPPPPPPSTVTVTVTGPCYGVSCDDTQLTYAYGVKVGDSVCTNSAVACSATVAAGSPIRIGIQPPTGSPGGWNVFPGDCPGGGRFSITTLSGLLEGGYVFEPCLTFTPGANTTISIGRS